MKALLLGVLVAAAVLPGLSSAEAEVQERRIEYKQGNAKLVGYLYSDESISGNAPGVLVFSDWKGLGPFAKERARELAALGYRAFAADIYGGGLLTKDTKEAARIEGKFNDDRPLMRARAQAALDTLKQSAAVDNAKIAAMGFCFGGMVALELARTGEPLAGAVSFHGGLDTPDTALAKNIKGKILVLHGADDPNVPAAEVEAFEAEMTGARVDWELVKYGGTVHSFTNPEAGDDPKKGTAYNELAAKRAFERMREFYREIL